MPSVYTIYAHVCVTFVVHVVSIIPTLVIRNRLFILHAYDITYTQFVPTIPYPIPVYNTYLLNTTVYICTYEPVELRTSIYRQRCTYTPLSKYSFGTFALESLFTRTARKFRTSGATAATTAANECTYGKLRILLHDWRVRYTILSSSYHRRPASNSPYVRIGHEKHS